MEDETLKTKILKAKEEHPHWGYQRIADLVGCSKNLVKFHTSPKCRADTVKRTQEFRAKNPLKVKLQHAFAEEKWRARVKQQNSKGLGNIKYNDLLQKIGDNPKCYLTGDDIDLSDTSNYHLDHILPKSRGGRNTLDNIDITIASVNRAKSDLTVEEFLELCKKVLTHNGYTVVEGNTNS